MRGIAAKDSRLAPYTIETLIGSGGMGEIYKALAAINHPHICQIYDVGSDDLVLEYFQGEPLGGPVTQR